eukprot:CAMPEP_0206365302 /NCGR_PEP_ID=MMETSP0294-20121207/2762_1 /ASSEMBLY_ACC=CAM_ASM_000327 /TAXON_ID=39354 /ORGANISM="Heterosigma akashiwo, Strain CCMP2393" /LENGTH=84 /DNA_ID=CAMNT_0053811123 /DNA_START=127 /DNA_END=378 /DNA_ORIENTATION=-
MDDDQNPGPRSLLKTTNTSKGCTPQKRRTTIRWDEETIAEHDKLRGTRQKIEEPPTPYHEYHNETDEDMLSDASGGSGGRHRAE